ncbi:hypothetical protein GPJ56_003467 [Histomonas meleagridis]|uniref:uncharacterized protein n=1 Tax=Histomonas meleagridis TaxID=135588 RepID=UPI00355A70D4|nr:hypothetical protein GPJ56_003467 [Histomonas meleagridis]KAH0799159.1 hypothetical protein GO595_007956 [Histomonas meleagridis]
MQTEQNTSEHATIDLGQQQDSGECSNDMSLNQKNNSEIKIHSNDNSEQVQNDLETNETCFQNEPNVIEVNDIIDQNQNIEQNNTQMMQPQELVQQENIPPNICQNEVQENQMNSEVTYQIQQQENETEIQYEENNNYISDSQDVSYGPSQEANVASPIEKLRSDTPIDETIYTPYADYKQEINLEELGIEYEYRNHSPEKSPSPINNINDMENIEMPHNIDETLIIPNDTLFSSTSDKEEEDTSLLVNHPNEFVNAPQSTQANIPRASFLDMTVHCIHEGNLMLKSIIGHLREIITILENSKV